jgi:cell division protein FtsN
MSRRVFYIVHLDRGRIAALSFVAAGLLLTAFATGYRFATRISPRPQESARVSLLDNDTPDPASTEIQPVREAALSQDERRRNPARPDDESSAEDLKRTDQREPRREKVNLLDAALPSESSTKPERKERRERKDNRQVKQKEEKKTTRKEKQKKDRADVETAAKEIKPDKPSRKNTESRSSEDATVRDTVADASVEPEVTSKKQSVYVLQMGAYQSRDAALRLSEEIRKHGINTYVRKTGKIHTVRTEGTTNREDLFRLEKKLKALNFSPVTVQVQDR